MATTRYATRSNQHHPRPLNSDAPLPRPAHGRGPLPPARHVIAEGIVSGKPVAAIARELGVSRSWASREAHAPETRKPFDALADQYREVFHALFETGLNAIARALAARKFVTRNGKRVDLGPDHRVRLKAAGLLQELLRPICACLADDRSQASVGSVSVLAETAIHRAENRGIGSLSWLGQG